MPKCSIAASLCICIFFSCKSLVNNYNSWKMNGGNPDNIKSNGKLLWKYKLPVAAFTTPATHKLAPNNIWLLPVVVAN